MFIKKLTLKNWRSHVKTSFEFGKVNIVRGPNNSGKSSLAQAIEYVLTGRCDGTDERGAGADKLITVRKDAKTATITALLTVNNGLQGVREATLERMRGPSGSALTLHYGAEVMNERQWDETVDRDQVSAALRVGRFLALNERAQSALLSDLLRPSPIAVPESLFEDADLVYGSGTYRQEKLSLEQVREIGERSVKARAECTAALRELGEPARVDERPAEAPSALQCQERLDSLRMEQNSLVRERETRLAAWQNRQAAARAALERIPQLEAFILPAAEEAELMKTVARESEIVNALHTISQLTFEIGELEQNIKTAERKAGKCPTCGHETDTDELVTRYKNGIDARKSRIAIAELTAGTTPLDVLKDRLRKHREAFTEVDRLRALLAETPADEAQPDTAALDAEIQDREERIKKGQGIVAEIAKHEAARDRYVIEVAKRATLQAKREAADRLAKWAPEAEKSMNSDKLGDFKGKLNEVMQKLGYDIQFAAETGTILVAPFPIGQQLRPAALSESEKWRFSVALQIAVAKVSGLDMIVLDGADVLVPANRGKLMQAIEAAGLEQAFVFASIDEGTSPGVFPAHVRVFTLEAKDGETHVRQEKSVL